MSKLILFTIILCSVLPAFADSESDARRADHWVWGEFAVLMCPPWAYRPCGRKILKVFKVPPNRDWWTRWIQNDPNLDLDPDEVDEATIARFEGKLAQSSDGPSALENGEPQPHRLPPSLPNQDYKSSPAVH